MLNCSNLDDVTGSVVCGVGDLVPYSGIAVLCGEQQLALFYVPDDPQRIYAIANFDPIGGANVLSRGILGDVAGQLVVASPLYKQHFSLKTGVCVEDPDVAVCTYPAWLRDDAVIVEC